MDGAQKCFFELLQQETAIGAKFIVGCEKPCIDTVVHVNDAV